MPVSISGTDGIANIDNQVNLPIISPALSWAV